MRFSITSKSSLVEKYPFLGECVCLSLRVEDESSKLLWGCINRLFQAIVNFSKQIILWNNCLKLNKYIFSSILYICNTRNQELCGDLSLLECKAD